MTTELPSQIAVPDNRRPSMCRRRRLAYAHVVAVHHTLYRAHRPFGAIAEPLALLLTTATAILWWADGLRFWLSLGAAILLLMQAVFPLVTDRCNRQVAQWSADREPPDWRAIIRRWELSHTVRAALMIAAALLLASTALT